MTQVLRTLLAKDSAWACQEYPAAGRPVVGLGAGNLGGRLLRQRAELVDALHRVEAVLRDARQPHLHARRQRLALTHVQLGHMLACRRHALAACTRIASSHAMQLDHVPRMASDSLKYPRNGSGWPWMAPDGRRQFQTQARV